MRKLLFILCFLPFLSFGQSSNYVVASGTNTYTATLIPTPIFIFKGTSIRVLFTNANTTASTITLNSFSPIALKKNASVALVANDILAGQIMEIVYDGTNFQLIGVSSSGGFTNPMTAQGDGITGGSGGTPTRLPLGSNGTYLSSNGTSQLWANLPSAYVSSITTTGSSGPATVSGGVLNVPQYAATNYISSLTTTGTSGPATVVSGVLNVPQYSGGTPPGSNMNLVYNNAGAFGAIGNGTAGQVLTTVTTGATPTWQTPSGGGAGATSIATANGFGGSVTSNVATITTSVNGVTTGNGTAMSGSNVYTTSGAGAVSDADLSLGSTTFGTDNTTVLQALLNKASTGTPITIIWDGKYSISNTLLIYSNTTIIANPGCGLIARNSMNKRMMTNANPTAGTHSDKNITIERLTINGNSKNQAHEVTSSGGGWVYNIRFAGADNITLRDMVSINSRTFHYFISNCDNVVLDRCYLDYGGTTYTDTYLATYDGVHVNGPCNYLTINDLVTRAFDDNIALNADDVFQSTNPTGTAAYNPAQYTYDPYASFGQITNVKINGVTFIPGARFGMRILSAGSFVDKVTIENVKGVTSCQNIIIDNWYDGSPANPGSGNIGTVTLRNWELEVPNLTGSGIPDTYKNTYFSIGCYIERLVLENIVRKDFTQPTYPTINVDQHAYVKELIVDKLTHVTGVAIPFINVGGVIEKLKVSNVSDLDVYSAIAMPVLKMNTSGHINDLSLNNILGNYITNIVDYNAGTINSIAATNINHRNSTSAMVSIGSNQTIKDFLLSSFYGTSPYTGSGTVKNSRGDGFIGQTTPTQSTQSAISTFDYAANGNLTSFTPEVGSAWTTLNSSAWSISDRRASPSGTAPASNNWVAVTNTTLTDGVFTFYVQKNIATNTYLQLWLRTTDFSNNIIMNWDNAGGITLNNGVSGSYTSFGTFSSLTVDLLLHVFEFTLSGTALSLKVDGVPFGTGTVPSTQTGTKFGIGSAAVATAGAVSIKKLVASNSPTNSFTGIFNIPGSGIGFDFGAGKGTSGQVLTTNGTTGFWATPGGTSATNPIDLTGGGGGTDHSYVGNYQDQLIVSQNRNPVTGVFSNTSKAAAWILVQGQNNDGHIYFYTSNLNNTSPTAPVGGWDAGGAFYVGNPTLSPAFSVTATGTTTISSLTGTGSRAVVASATGVLSATSSTFALGGNFSTANAFTTSGAFALTLTTTAATNVTFPTSGTLATTTATNWLSSGGSTALTANSARTGSFTYSATSNGETVAQNVLTSVWGPTFKVSGAAHTGETAGTSFPAVIYDLSQTIQHAVGNISVDLPTFSVLSGTHTAASGTNTASGVTSTWRVDGAPNGTASLMSLSTSAAFHVPTKALTNVTNGLGLYIVAPTGATNNYAAFLQGDLQLQGHDIQTTGNTPTLAAGTGAGTSPTVSVVGSDQAGVITVTTGTGPVSGSAVVTLTFNAAYKSAPRVIILDEGNINSAGISGLSMVYVNSAGITTTTFAITSGGTGLSAATTYIWYYKVIQ